jgi:pyridoxine 5-phosphate synthase
VSVRQLVVSLESLCALRESGGAGEMDVAAAALLAELAGAGAVRLAVSEDLRVVRERDVRDVRRAVRGFELCMSPTQTLLKLALDARPDVVVLAGEAREGAPPRTPVDARSLGASVVPVVRSLREAGITALAIVAPDLDAVKAAHASGVTSVELYSGALVDLPRDERAAGLERLGDAARLAAKLRLGVRVGGGLGPRSVPEAIAAAAVCEGVCVGRALVARAVLVGMDRAVRDLRALLA